MTVEIREAETKLSQLAESAAGGEDVILLRDGKPVARIMSLEAVPLKRQIGLMDGLFTVPEDFDTMFAAEIEEMFYGNPDKLEP